MKVFWREVIGPTGVDESFTAQMRFPQGVFAQFDCSVKLPYHVFMEIVGEKATLIIPNPFNPSGKERHFLSVDGKGETIPVNGRGSHFCEVENMADAILLGEPPRATLEDSRLNTVTILPLFESAKSGNPVTLQYQR